MSDFKRFILWVSLVAWAFFSLVFPVNAQTITCNGPPCDCVALPDQPICSDTLLAANTIVVKKRAVAASAAAPDACTACPDATNGADLLCEDFEEGDDYLCTFEAEAIDVGDSIAGAAHSGTLGCTNKGSKALQTVLSVGTSDTYAMCSVGSQQEVSYTSFYINIVSESLANGNYATVFMASSGVPPVAATNRTWNVFLYQNAGVLYFYLEKKGAGGYNNITSAQAINTGTWYKLDILWDSNTPLSQFWIDGVSQGSSADVNTFVDPQYFGPGALDATIDAAVTYQIDILKVDDDTRPSACP